VGAVSISEMKQKLKQELSKIPWVDRKLNDPINYLYPRRWDAKEASIEG
jgi:hypothetical protein